MSLKPNRTMGVCAVLAVCAAAAAPAWASDATLRSTVRASVPTIERSQAKILQGAATLQRTHNAKPLIRALGAQDRALASFKAKLAHEGASSAAGRKGRTDLMKGLGLIIKSNSALTRDLRRSQKHQVVSKRSLNVTVKEARAGNRDLSMGAKLLHA